MEGGNEVSEANGITHSPSGERDFGFISLVRLRRCEAARAEGQGYASEKARFGVTRFQAGTDLVGCVTTLPLVASLPSFNPLFLNHNLITDIPPSTMITCPGL